MKKINLVLFIFFLGCGRTGLLPSSFHLLCGNEIIDKGEECDGSNLGVKSCVSLGYLGGTLSCTSSCEFDTSQCYGNLLLCGNKKIDEGEECDDGNDNQTDACIKCKKARCGDGFVFKYVEECDRENLDQKTCQDLGYIGGRLKCTEECRFDFNECKPHPWCGNGVIDPGEECDPARPEDYNKCTFVCKWKRCGNNRIDEGESCDGMNLGGYRCEDLGYDGGTLECNERCKFDPSKCGFCGDRRLDPWENCEEDLPLSDTCISLGYDGGKLRCIRCRFDISGCHLCGNGIIEGPEECDDGNKRDGDGCDSSCRIDLKCGNGIAEGFEECDKRDLKGETCESLGYEGGPLFCTRDCKFDISMCWICGNGRKDPNEECEGEDLGNHTCISLGFDRGRLFCKPNCEFNTNNCSKCGDRIIDRPWEECDQDNLDHQTCRSRGYLRGVLKCDQHCYFDESGCISAPKCGNGIIEEGEVCDRENLGGMTCMDLGYPGGVLACRLNCLEFDIRNCWQCGNGKREGDEECDLEDVGGETCESLGWGPGTLGCKSNCEFDFSGCSIIDKCGNGRIDPGEICDGENVGNTTCIDLGFLGGTLTCKPNCKEFDTSRCEEPRCGNRIIEGNEACDRDNFNHQTCRDFGFDGGFLVCKEDCSEILLDKCYNYGKCGDNKINQPEEECDGQDLGQHECRDFYPYDGGTLKCNPDCTFNFSQCYTTEKCGDGNIDPPGEECDGRDLGGYDCTNLPPPYKRWEGGNLGCTPQCKFDTSGCYRPVANCDPVSGYGCEKDEKCIFKLFTDGTRIWHELYCVQIGDILPGGLCDHDGECTLGAGCDWWDALPRRCYQYCYMDGSGPPCTPKNTVCVRIPPFPEGIGQCI